ncbi:MAG: sodium-dependent transporter [Deltaproteobacteria bacterium]|jgi:NSS family neurotransmitter:Na+ symporter|nr:sodium-dependent transporter [Deltaproteobacteria bacterium]MBW2540731.1 sodium-dependent transporter [Deltaproteobacteria bacterium]
MAGVPREQWTSKRGFVLAAIGSAVGLGNMWRFSYLAAENGGAAFVFLYLLATLVVGLPVLLAELVLGRGSQKSPIQALAHYGGQRWKPLGLLFVVTGLLILSYYAVIAGWAVRYGLAAITSGFDPDAAAHFAEVASGADAFAFHVVFMALTIFVVVGGVSRGIERTSMVLMPLLFALVVGLALYAATLSGASAGYAYYLAPDFSKLLSLNVLKDATGQAFFSLSLGMGALLTFASYLGRDVNLPRAAGIIAGADIAIAFIAGLVVFPLIFALDLSADVGASTVGALFITLPKAFAEMGGVGRGIGILFFAALIVGALTSAISLLEVVVSSAIDNFGWSRRRAGILLGIAITALGAPSAWNTDILGAVDQIANNILLLGGGLALSIFVGWVMAGPIEEVSAGTSGASWFGSWRNLLRYAVPLFLSFVLIYDAIPSTFETILALF